MHATQIGIAIAVIAVGLLVGLFVVDFGAATPTPVDFDDTVTVGLTLEDELRLDATDEDDVELPRVQVFYSQYPYVVGYYGVEQFVAAQRQPAHEQRFGHPLAVYVTDFDVGTVTLTDERHPAIERDPAWIAAEDAIYVVGSDAETPAGETVVPFSSRESAEAFTTEYGGTAHTWDDVLDASFDVDDAETVDDRIADQHRGADASIETSSTLRDRPIEVVVGEDVETVQAGIDAAPPNSTVYVSSGTYDETVEIDRSVTIVGEDGARLRGDGNGTVITVTAGPAAVVGLDIDGVGDRTPGAAATDDHAHGGGLGGDHEHDHGEGDEEAAWDASIEDDYARGDAGIAVNRTQDVLIADVEIHTPAAGIVFRDAPGFVVRNVTVVGNDDYRDGHMGMVAMRSPGVVEESTFEAGLDGVYTHRANGIVVRDNTMVGNRMGIHLMHTSGALLADNTVSEQESTGIYVMTGPQRNGLVGNEISETPTAIDVGGSDTYVAENVLTNNDLGIRIDATASIFEENVVAGNREGATVRALLPTNRVTRNDFVDNQRHVGASTGPLRVWTHDDRGNYWEGAVGSTDGAVLDRPYTPTDAVDGRLHRVDGTETLAQAPAVDALSGFEASVSGMRANEIVDTAPLCEPVNGEWFEHDGLANLDTACGSDAKETRNGQTTHD